MTIDSDGPELNSFLVTAGRDCDAEDCDVAASPDRSGSLQILSPEDGATFHPECINTIVSSDPETARRDVRFMWLAPKTGSGCVYIR